MQHGTGCDAASLSFSSQKGSADGLLYSRIVAPYMWFLSCCQLLSASQ